MRQFYINPERGMLVHLSDYTGAAIVPPYAVRKALTRKGWHIYGRVARGSLPVIAIAAECVQPAATGARTWRTRREAAEWLRHNPPSSPDAIQSCLLTRAHTAGRNYGWLA